MGIGIRQIRADEAEAATELFIQAYEGAPWHESWSKENARERLRELSSTPNWIGVGAFNKRANLVGLSIGVPHTSSAGKSLYISELVVCPDHQRQGIGRRLMEAIQDLARENSFCSSWLVSQSTGNLLEFYEKNQFVRSQGLSVYSLKFETK